MVVVALYSSLSALKVAALKNSIVKLVAPTSVGVTTSLRINARLLKASLISRVPPPLVTEAVVKLFVLFRGTRETDETGFNNRSIIRKLKVTPNTGASVDSYIIEFFTKDTFSAPDLEYQATGNGTFIDNDLWFHEDEDGTSELHLKITNNSNSASTFTIDLIQEEVF